MIYKLVNIVLRFIVRRDIFILLNIITLIFSLYCLKGMSGIIHFFSNMKEEELDQMNEILDGIAGVFVAIGVLMEERETIQKIAKSTISPVDEHLNEIAHHNGLGLLLGGLFMELISLMIESPKNIVNTSGIEKYLYAFGFLIIVFAALIQVDFIKDYLISYFRKTEKNSDDTMNYTPGLHILLTITPASNSKLKDADEWVSLIDSLVLEHGLQSLGYIKHTFPGSGGYTSVHCLTESHISIHTWPEYNLCTCDVFLSNYKKDNSVIVKAIKDSIIKFFDATNCDIKEVVR